MKVTRAYYKTALGKCYHANVEELLAQEMFKKNKGLINLILTSPPFPLNRKKQYGNLNGRKYIKWLTKITSVLKDYLADDGSLVIEIGNSWDEKGPFMSTLPLEALMAIKREGGYNLCQQFVWFNTAKLPSPAQWVNIERIRVKDAFTHIWWLSKSVDTKANNKNVLEQYSHSMRKLLKTKKYNAGLRPSEHQIGETSFLKNNGGAIPSNVLIGANTASNSAYLRRCKEVGLAPHPARMPSFIAEFFIRFLTEKYDIVLDPFAGSNTTGDVSESLGRRWIAVEANLGYVDTSRLRFRDGR